MVGSRVLALVCLVTLCANAESEEEIGHFLHLSDVHIDLDYVPGSPQYCIEDDLLKGMGCCHGDSYFSMANSSDSCSVWGSYNCDASPKWVAEGLEWIAKNTPSLDFIINTGDFASHHELSQSPWKKEDAVAHVARLTADAFPRTLQLNVIGNHDGWPLDNTLPFVDQMMLGNFSTTWGPFLAPEAAASISAGGYYSHLITKGLRFIALNILWYERYNVMANWNGGDPEWDPLGMWVWLEEQLLSARAMNETVWLGHHFGPGSSDAGQGYTVRMTQIYERYKDVIKQTFCGHTHNSRLMLFHTHDKQPVQACWAPGAFYFSHHNAQFHLFKYNRRTFQILDFIHYECDLDATIAADSPVCGIAYSFSELSQAKEFNLASLVELKDTLQSNHTLLNVYHKHLAPGGTDRTDAIDCDDDCKSLILSAMVVVSPELILQQPNSRAETTNRALVPNV